MKHLKRIVTLAMGMALGIGAYAQEENSYVHEQSDGYEWPTDKAVLEKLECPVRHGA